MFTIERFRGKGIAPYLRYQSYGVLKNMGRVKIYSYSDFFNAPSIKFKKKLNAKFLKVCLYVEPEKTLKIPIFLMSSSEQMDNLSANLYKFGLFYLFESLQKEFLVGISFWQIEIVFASREDQTRRQREEFSVKSL